MNGTVYLLHFDAQLGHAQHYIGWALDAMDRVNGHLEGKGSAIVAALVGQGDSAELVRTWDGDRNLERKLKDRKNARQLCPKCKDAFNARAAANMRRYRSGT